MKRIGKLILILSASIPTITGCWDFESLRDRTIILGLAIDSRNEGYSMLAETPKFPSGKQSESSTAQTDKLAITYPIKSVEIPLHDIQKQLSGRPYYPNLRILAIGKEQAKEGIADIVSHFIRDPDMRRTTQVVIAEREASELLGMQTSQDAFTSFYLESLLKKNETTGHSKRSDIGLISKEIHEKAVSLIPLLGVKSQKEARVIGLAVMDNGKWAGSMNEAETEAVAYVKDPAVSGGSIRMNCPKTNQGSVAMDVIRVKTKIEPQVEGDRLIVRGQSRLTGYLSEFTCADGKVRDRSSLNLLEANFEELLNQSFNKQIEAVLRRTGVDVLALRGKLERKPKEWRNIEPRFSELLRNAEVNIQMKVELKSKGSES